MIVDWIGDVFYVSIYLRRTGRPNGKFSMWHIVFYVRESRLNYTVEVERAIGMSPRPQITTEDNGVLSL